MKKYIEKIEKLPKEFLSKNQKKIIIDSLKLISEKGNNELADYLYRLLIRRVKTGFVFDESPQISDNEISILVESKELQTLNNNAKNENSLIIGENFNVLKNLLITHREKIDIIYIDPPYNTKNEYIFSDKESRTGWLNMMNERLKLAKELLSMGGGIASIYWW